MVFVSKWLILSKKLKNYIKLIYVRCSSDIYFSIFLEMSGNRVVFYLGGGPLTTENQWPRGVPTPAKELHTAIGIQGSPFKPSAVGTSQSHQQTCSDYV